MSLYFIIDFIAYFTGIYVYTRERISPRNLTPDNPSQLYDKSENKTWFELAFLIIYLLNIPQILVGYSIIYFKDQKDMINEINKLNDIKVSIFQKDKIVNPSVDTKSEAFDYLTKSQKVSFL